MPGRRTPKTNQRLTRSSRRLETESDESDTEHEYLCRPDYSSYSTSKTSFSSTDRSFSDSTDRSPVSRYDEQSPRSRTSTPGSTPSRRQPLRSPNSHQFSDSCDSYQNIYPSLHESTESVESEKLKKTFHIPEDYKVKSPPRSTSSSELRHSTQRSFEKESQDLCWVYLAIFAFVAFFIAAFWFNWPSSEVTIDTEAVFENDTQYKTFIREVEKLHVQFPKQDKRLWTSVIASSRHIFKTESTFPSVIVLASQVKSRHLSFCIAEKITSRFLLSRGIELDQIPSTDIENIRHLKAKEQKLSLDKDVRTVFESPDGKAYIIRNLQSLSPQAALLLHGLCDGDNAPYKDVMILMTLEIEDSKQAMNANAAEDFLANLWTSPQVEYDKVAAVMSRISNNLVILQQEDTSVIDQMCSHV